MLNKTLPMVFQQEDILPVYGIQKQAIINLVLRNQWRVSRFML